MFFRTVALFAAMAMLASCSLKTNEAPPPVNPPNTKLGDFDSACLENVLPTFGQFAKGTAATKDLRLAFQCLKGGVELVHNELNGQENKDQFNQNEFRSFFATIVMGKDPSVISDSLIFQIFQIKKLLAGGESTSFTKIEMKRFMRMLDNLSDLSVELLPAMQILTLDWVPNGTVTENINKFESSNIIIQSVARKLGALIQANGSEYALDNVPLFLKELEKLYGKNWEFIAELENVLPIVKELKTSLTGGSPDVVDAKEWTRMMLLMGRGYIQYARYYYFIQEKNVIGRGNLELAYIFRSIEDMFSVFGDLIQEKPEKVLTKNELLRILQSVRKLFPKFEVTEKLVTEVMRIKQLFFGGGSDNWTDLEFKNAQGKVAKFEVITKAIVNRGDVLSFGWKFDPKDIEAARAAVNATEVEMLEASQQLASLMEQDYDLKFLVTFTQELEKILKRKDGSPVEISVHVQKFLPVGIAIKNILLRDQGDLVRRSQWAQLLPAVIPLLMRALEYNYFLEPQPSWTSGEGVKELDLLLGKAISNLEAIINTQPVTSTGYREISLPSLYRLVDSLAIAGMLPEGVRSITIKNLLNPLFKRVLVSPEDRLRKINFSGLSLYQTRTITQELGHWVRGQRLIESWYAKGPTQNLTLSRSQILNHLNATPASSLREELRLIFSSPIDLTYDSEGRLRINAGNFGYNQELLSQVNLVRGAVRLVTRAASESLSNINSYRGISLVEFNRIFDEIKPFIYELGFLDPRDPNFANSRFRDANLFTTTADGSDLMSFKEGFDLVQMIISGEKLASMYMDEMLSQDSFKECNVNLSLPKNDRMVGLPCILKVFGKYRNKMYAGIPRSLTYMSKLSPEENEDLIYKAILAGGADFDSKNFTKVVETTQAPHAFQYIEMLMRRFDSDGDGVFTNPEALAAYPTFESIIRKVSGLKNPKENKAVFMWFLRYGKPPTSLGDKLNFKFIWSKKKESDWKVNTDRRFLIQVLAFLSGDSTGKKSLLSPSDDSLDVSSLTEEDKVWACDPTIFPNTPKEFCSKN